jgi:hypothetical protein
MTKTTKLEEHLREMQIHSSPYISDEIVAERERLQEEKESIKQCLAICAMASEHLREFENKVAVERERLQEKEDSTKQCLTLCTNALEYIGKLQSNLSGESSRDTLTSSEQTTASALQECEDIFINVTVDLEQHIQEIRSGLQALSGREADIWGEDATIRTV